MPQTVRRVPHAVIGARVDPSPPAGGGASSARAPMTDGGAEPILCRMITTTVQTAVEVTGVRRAYGAVQALDGVDLTRPPGELLALLGPNGAGKTTLVEILEGHRRADAGEVRVLGHDPALRERAFLERIGIVLQEEGLDPNITVREAVELYCGRLPAPAPGRRGARARRARRPRRRPRRHALRRPAPPARPRARHRRRPRAAVPRRADHRLRSLRSPPGVGADRPPARARQDDPAHHALHGGGAGRSPTASSCSPAAA